MEEIKREAFSEVLWDVASERGIEGEATFRTLLALACDGEILALANMLGLSELEMMRLALAYTFGE